MRVFVYWLVFTSAAVWAQFFLRGVDILAVGLMVSLQEEDFGRTFWLGLVWVFMQEGMGNLAFGPVGLLYACFGGVYFLGRWLFSPKSLIFVCLLGLVLAGLRLALVLIMAALGDLVVVVPTLVDEALVQAGVFPVAWLLASACYARMVLTRERAIRI